MSYVAVKHGPSKTSRTLKGYLVYIILNTKIKRQNKPRRFNKHQKTLCILTFV